MDNNTTVFQARRPSEISQLLLLSLNMGVWSYFLFTGSWNYYLSIAGIAVLLFIEGTLIYRIITARGIFEITIEPESIAVKDITIEARDIKNVFVKGYFKPVIGIRPKGNVLVPYKYCFCFASDSYIKDLTAWAEQRQITVSRKGFKRWL